MLCLACKENEVKEGLMCGKCIAFMDQDSIIETRSRILKKVKYLRIIALYYRVKRTLF